MKNKWTGLIVILLWAVLALCAVFSMREKSATYDELPHLGHGYYYLNTGECTPSTPLVNIMANIPLLFLDLGFPRINQDADWQNLEAWGYRFGRELLYENNEDADKILFWGRIPIVLISLLGGLVVFKWAEALYGKRAGIFALFLYCLSPNILAYCRLVTHDLAVSAFIVLALYQFWLFKGEPSFRNLLFAGLGLGLALSSKHTTFLILPTYLLYGFKLTSNRQRCGIFLIFLIGFFILGLCSQFSFIDYFKGFLGLGAQARSSFLMGEAGWGWWYYFIVAFLIKTPIPTLIFILMSLFFFKRIRSKDIGDEFLLIMPILTIFGMASYSRFNIGLRHILPIYPLIFVFVSKVANLRVKGAKLLIPLLCGWYLISSLNIYPHYIAYFNELVGGPRNGYRYLVDSNLDWGQDLKGLKRWMDEEGLDRIYLAYYGTASQDYHLPSYQYLPGIGWAKTDGSHVLPLNVDREMLAISVHLLVVARYPVELPTLQYRPAKGIYSWLKKYEPVARIGYSIHIYDITNDPFAHKKLGEIYLNCPGGPLLEEALREYKKVLELDPDDRMAREMIRKLRGGP